MKVVPGTIYGNVGEGRPAASTALMSVEAGGGGLQQGQGREGRAPRLSLRGVRKADTAQARWLPRLWAAGVLGTQLRCIHFRELCPQGSAGGWG